MSNEIIYKPDGYPLNPASPHGEAHSLLAAYLNEVGEVGRQRLAARPIIDDGLLASGQQ